MKKRWRGLRDTFRKELKKSGEGGAGDKADSQKVTTWPFFNLLLFLTDRVTLRNLQGHAPNVSEFRSTDQSDDKNINDVGNNLVPQTSQSTGDTLDEQKFNASKEQAIKNHPNKKLKRMVDVDVRLLETEETDIKHCKKSAKTRVESDYYFLLSLLPYMKDVPHSRKMVVRSKLQEVFIKEQQYRELHLQRQYSPYPSSYSQSSSDSVHNYFE